MGVRTLYVLRHAKSSWDHPDLDDRQRPLSRRGQRDAKRVAKYLATRTPPPALVLCSSALRTRQTLAALEGVLAPTTEVKIEDDVYGAMVDELIERLQGVAPAVDSVLLIGHNPGVGDLVLRLTGEADAGALALAEEKFPTGALATLSFTGPWAELAPGTARLDALVVPRQLAD
ncbi:MAG TPA: histidine phosphatase family protein [Acidimicrobiales bacterium]|nr:histidine phosphatase family protein [Acidimicrobiales bacterium]